MAVKSEKLLAFDNNHCQGQHVTTAEQPVLLLKGAGLSVVDSSRVTIPAAA